MSKDVDKCKCKCKESGAEGEEVTAGDDDADGGSGGYEEVGHFGDKSNRKRAEHSDEIKPEEIVAEPHILVDVADCKVEEAHREDDIAEGDSEEQQAVQNVGSGGVSRPEDFLHQRFDVRVPVADVIGDLDDQVEGVGDEASKYKHHD